MDESNGPLAWRGLIKNIDAIPAESQSPPCNLIQHATDTNLLIAAPTLAQLYSLDAIPAASFTSVLIFW